MMETVCAFANEPGLRGGYLLLGAKRTGIAEDGRPIYEPENIGNTDKIQSDFVAMCNSMFNVRIRPIINVEEYLGKTVFLSRTMKRISLRQDFCSIISSARRIWSGWRYMLHLI